MHALLKRFDVRISLMYGVVAALWILCSDALLAMFTNDTHYLLTTLSQVKGLGFVAATTLALFSLISTELQKRTRLEQALQEDIRQRKQTEEAEREQRHLAEAMRDSLAALTTSHDVEEVLRKILDYAATVVVSEAGSIMLFEDNAAHVAYLRGYPQEAETFFQRYRFTPDSMIYDKALVKQQPYLVSDTHLAEQWLPLPATDWIRSSLSIPIAMRGKVIGVLVADSAEPHHFQPKDIENLQLFAHYASLALENADHVRQLEQKVAERTAELQAAKDRVEAILNNSLDGILMVDSDLRIQQANPSVNRLVGYTADQSYQRSLLDFVAKADRERIRAIIDAGASTQAGHQIEIHALRHDPAAQEKARFDAELTIGYINDGGLVCTLRDITARNQAAKALRESEENYRQLVETMQGGLAIFNPDEQITYVNDRFCELLGYTRTELIGARSYDFVDTIEIEKLDAQVARRRQAESSSYEIIARRKDGQRVYLLVAGSPLLDKDGVYIGSVAVTTDITAQKQAETALRQALTKEKELGELKSRFISMASHEFRTPLATILALTETLAAYRPRLTETQIDQRLHQIREQVAYLKGVMEDVLLLARMQARRGEFTPTLVDLDGLCRSIIDEFENQPTVTHHLIYRCDKQGTDVRLDRQLMRRIISNLLTNAIKYSPVNKQITLTLTFTPAVVMLQISDEGIGIPDSDQPHLFEPFHRATNVGTIPGTGLGLVITKEAVALHKGEIQVESQVDVGTTFTVTIPIADTEETETNTAPVETEP